MSRLQGVKGLKFVVNNNTPSNEIRVSAKKSLSNLLKTRKIEVIE